MRKLVVIEFLSLDGVYQAPGGPNEDTEGGFKHGGWQRPFFDDVMGAAVTEGMAQTDAHLFGRKTYEIMAAFWPTAPSEEEPIAQHLNSVEKYVASRTLQKAEWQNSTIIRNVPEEVAKLKEQPGKNIAVLGSGNLVQSLIELDLVDEYSLMVFPIVLGSGKRLFPDSESTKNLRLVDSKPTSTGAVMLTYQPVR